MMKKWIILGICICFSSFLFAQSSPISMLQNTADQILATLKENKANLKSNHQIIYHAVESNLLPIVDVSGMSRSVLGRDIWEKATPSERKQFSQAFTQLVIRTYASPLAEYTDETVKFLPIREALTNRFVRVNSIIVRSNKNDIHLNYSLVSIDGRWRVYDLSVEGVSLLQSFRSQFSQALTNSNINKLIQQMQARNNKVS